MSVDSALYGIQRGGYWPSASSSADVPTPMYILSIRTGREEATTSILLLRRHRERRISTRIVFIVVGRWGAVLGNKTM